MNQDLLLKYILGKASQQEKEEVAEWLDESNSHLSQFMILRKSYDALIWQDSNDIFTSEKKIAGNLTVSFRMLWRIVAIVAITLGLGIFTWQSYSDDIQHMHSIYVPAGQRTQVTLADGSVVWLNGKSTLTFPDKFSDDVRQVKLEGEGYFEVEKDVKRPFLVSTLHRSAVRVLGTRFNIKAHKDAKEVITTLIDGNVKFEFYDSMNQSQYIQMKPGQQLVYNLENGQTELHATTGNVEVSWKDGKIIFYRNSLREALDILAITYDVDFLVQANVSHEDSFTGTFSHKSLEQILNYFIASSSIKWRYIERNGAKYDDKTLIEIY